MKALIDTHVLVEWFAAGAHLARGHRRAISRASASSPLLVSDVSLWEVAVLAELGRIRLALPLRDWLEQATAPPLVRRCPITPAVAAETTCLPAGFPRDPADRIIVATARVHGAVLLTRDARIVESGAVRTG
jgi:PIN domain nuclease of toxin-antitoxin system